MVLADFSAGHRRPRAALAAVVAGLALCCVFGLLAFAALSAQAARSSRVALAGRYSGDVLGAAADAAARTLRKGLSRLQGSHTVQQRALSQDMHDALAAVKELKAGSVREVDRAGGRRGRVSAKHTAAQKLVHKSLAKVRIAAQHGKTDDELVGDMQGSDNRRVRDELRKMVDVTQRLSEEMKKMPDHAARTVARVQRKLGAVAHVASGMQEVASEEDEARQRVVAHELAVRKKKLAEAEEEEQAAQRAAIGAIAAEKLAVQKHHEAAADEAAAHQRRVAARRAAAIAARGQMGKFAHSGAMSPTDSIFPKTAEEGAGGQNRGKGPSKRQVASECTTALAKYGCGGLMADNPCLAFCEKDSAVRRAARSQRSEMSSSSTHSVPLESGWAVHDRTGFFATGQDRDTYVDSVYGDRGDESSLLSPQPSTKDGFPDVAADGHDYSDEQESESMGSAQNVLAHEDALKRRLQESLTAEQADNTQLKRRLAQQKNALRSLSSSLAYVSGIPLDERGEGQSFSELPNTPPLPSYKSVTGSQELAQVNALHSSGVLLHDPSDSVNTDSEAPNGGFAAHNPYAP